MSTRPILCGMLARALHAAATVVSHLNALRTAIRHRRQIAALFEHDERLLADIGLARSDLRDAARLPVWRDPTDLLSRRVVAMRLRPRTFAAWLSIDNVNRRALPTSDEDELHNLSGRGGARTALRRPGLADLSAHRAPASASRSCAAR